MKKTALDLSQRVQRIQPSPTLALSARAEELKASGKAIINLSVGEPDFDTPEHIKEAAIRAIHEGHTKYTPVDGIKSLKQAIVDKFARENHLHYALNQVMASCGAKHCLYNLFAAVLNSGDQVIIPAPYWVSYPDIVELTDGEPVIVATTHHDSFKLTPEKLEKAITERTRAIVLNSPSNPTGKAYSLQELKALGECLLRYPDILIVSDDIYEHHLWNHKPFANILNATPELYDRTVVVNGVSKTYAMTGWRIGYAAGPASIIAAMKKAQSQSTSHPTSIAQYAAVAALNGDQTCVQQMTDAFKARHDFFYSELKKMTGLECSNSDGTFYIFPSIAPFLNKHPEFKDDLAVSEHLLQKAEIAVVPGSAFGAPGFLRMSFATDMENLKLAVERLHTIFGV